MIYNLFGKCRIWIFILIGLSIGNASCDTKMESITKLRFTITCDTPWVVSEEQPEPVKRALDDVKSDWYKVFGQAPVILKELPDTWTDPVIYLGQKGVWSDTMIREPFSGTESFILRVQNDNKGRKALVATGADMRGSIYAAYALSEEILGVDPWYYWVDKEPSLRDSINIPTEFKKIYGSPTFKYRGWFINDEDLLNGFSPDPLRENVFSLEMYDKIYETLLRLRGNMIVPATFPFPDERCQELAARRGLILNMHHILVLGLNTYRWPNEVPFSFSKHPEIMENYWETCINAFKDYEVVWTVGYRGKHDRPFWDNEPELKTPEARGKVIADAIAKQVRIIREVQPQADIIANMWMEGADLYLQGLIKLPEGVTLVWPDNGAGIIRDEGHVQDGQGIYYHTAMLNGRSNQLSEMVNPGRIYDQILRFVRAKATSFFLVNVSDIRPVPLSTDCVMKLVWNARPFLNNTNEENMTNFLKDWSQRQFGSETADQIAAIYKQYFEISYMQDNVLEGENTIHTKLRKLDQDAGPLISQGKQMNDEISAKCQELLNFSLENHEYLAKVVDQANSIISQVPSNRKDFYQSHVLTQLQIHLKSLETLEYYCRSLVSYNSGNKAEALSNSEKALHACKEIFINLKKAEYGKWAGWYKGECFVGLENSYDIVRTMIAQLKNKPVSLIRKRRGYEDVEKYQEVFAKNFPLLYPNKPCK